MRITFLGTGTSQGVPVIACQCDVCKSSDPKDKRLRTSALIETDGGKNILVDIGPDFREQMLREHVTHIDSILISHAHRDHVAGIDDIRPLNYFQQQKMEIYGNTEALTQLQRDYAYIFEPHIYPGLPEVELHILSGDETFSAAEETIVPIKAMHKDLPILGYRIGKLAYITDANYISPQEMEKLQDLNVLVINALRKEKHFSHFCLPEALEVINQVHPREAYLTHMCHDIGFYAVTNKELPPHVHLAYDGLRIEV